MCTHTHLNRRIPPPHMCITNYAVYTIHVCTVCMYIHVCTVCMYSMYSMYVCMCIYIYAVTDDAGCV